MTIEYRWAESRFDRLPALASELVSRRPSTIVAAGSTAAALAVKEATTTIPVVFEAGVDAVAAGLVSSMSRPGAIPNDSTMPRTDSIAVRRQKRDGRLTET